MNFLVNFTARDNYAIDIVGQDVGLFHLDSARFEFGPQISEVSRVLPLREDVILSLTEEQARASGQFDRSNHVNVTVPQAALNRFAEIAYRVSSRNQKCAEAYYCVDKALLLGAWMQAGYPLTWDLV